MNHQGTFLCLSSYFKGSEFLIGCKEMGNKVYLITSRRLEHEPWPRAYLDDIFFMDEVTPNKWDEHHLLNGFAHFIRDHKVDRIIALDDFDVEKAASLREHFRIPGMGQSTARFFRDKLAMRIKAYENGIPVPAFTRLFNNQEINDYMAFHRPPWLIKPRSEASAAGIKKVYNQKEAWNTINDLGDERHNYLMEQFRPGDVFHVDALSLHGDVIFSVCSQYLNTPFEVAHGGGIFQTVTLETNSHEQHLLNEINARTLKAFGMTHSASHAEFIRDHETGEFIFLETSSRVGGAHISDMVEAAAGINIWAEWAKLESCMNSNNPYHLPNHERQHAGLIISLSRFEHPDTSGFSQPEIYWRINKKNHIGFVVKSKDRQRILGLLEEFASRIARDFHASMPSG